MAEINERTKVSLQIGGAAVLLLAVLGAGVKWGEWSAERAYTRQTLASHGSRLDGLDARVVSVEKLTGEIRAEQKVIGQNAETASRNTTALLWAHGNLKTALAQVGVKFNDKDEE